MAQADPRLRKLKIQTGVVKRITKEKGMYEKEAIQLEKKIEDEKAKGTDEYVIKKQLEVLQESKGMVPDTKKRLTTAFADLENVMQEAEEDLGETKEFEEAKKALEDAKLALA